MMEAPERLALRQHVTLGGRAVGVCARGNAVCVATEAGDELRALMVSEDDEESQRWVGLGPAGTSYALAWGRAATIFVGDDDDLSRVCEVEDGGLSRERPLFDGAKTKAKGRRRAPIVAAASSDAAIGVLLGDGSVRIEGESVRWAHGSPGTALCAAADALCAGDVDGATRVWRADATCRARLDCGVAAPVAALAVAGTRLIAAHEAGTLIAWELAAGVPVGSWKLDVAGLSSFGNDVVVGCVLRGGGELARLRFEPDSAIIVEDLDTGGCSQVAVGDSCLWALRGGSGSDSQEDEVAKLVDAPNLEEEEDGRMVIAAAPRNVAVADDQDLAAGRWAALADFPNAETARRALDEMIASGEDAEAAREVRERLEVFEELSPSVENWARLWPRFRDADDFGVAAAAARAGDSRRLVAVWRRLLGARAARGGAIARAKFSEMVVEACVEGLPIEAAPAFVPWLCDDVVPALRGTAARRVAAWARDAARGLALAGRTDDARYVADELLRALEAPLSVAAVAVGATADAWLASSNRNDREDDPLSLLRGLARRLNRVVELRDAHGACVSTLASYEATDASEIAVALLDRVREPSLVAAEISHHVRPICAAHRVDADELLLAYVEARDADADRGVAVIGELRGEHRRVEAALALVTAARPPYPESLLNLARREDRKWRAVAARDGADSLANALLDAMRLARLAHVAHTYGVSAFDAGDAAQARRLAGIVVARAAAERDADVRDAALDDAELLAAAYPATLSTRGVVVAFAARLADRDDADPRNLGEIAARAVARRLPRGAERQAARREIVAACRRALDFFRGEGCAAAATAAVGAAVGSALVDEAAKTAAPTGPRFRHDATQVDDLRRVAALYEEFGRIEASPETLRDPDVLERAAAPLLATPEDNRSRLDRLAELVDAPSGWAAAALATRDRDASRADELYETGGGGAHAACLRDLATTLAARAMESGTLLGDGWRPVARRVLAQAVALEPLASRRADDAISLEALRLVDAVAARCVGTRHNTSYLHHKNDGLLLVEAHLEPRVADVLEALKKDDATSSLDAATERLVDALAANDAWRLVAQALQLRSAVRGRSIAPDLTRDAFARQLRTWLLAVVDRASDVDTIAGLASAAPRRAVFAAYKEALGNADLDQLGTLALVGRAVAARLDEPRLEATSAALAADAKWWRLLEERKVPFDHARLRRRRNAECDHARQLLAPLLDRQKTTAPKAPLSADEIETAYAFCDHFGVPRSIAAEALAARLLSRGARKPQDLGDAVSSALKIVNPSRRLLVLRAAISETDPRAYDRLDLALGLAIDATKAGDEVRGPGDIFASPSRDLLEKWRRVVRWLDRVRSDAATTLGVEAATTLGDDDDGGGGAIPFHDLVRAPLATLEPLLSEDAVPRLAKVAKWTGLEPAALWCRLADSRWNKKKNDESENDDDDDGASGWKCLDQAAATSPALAAKAAVDRANALSLQNDDDNLEAALDAWTRARSFAAAWAKASKSADARETVLAIRLKRRDVSRRALSRAFFPRNNNSIEGEPSWRACDDLSTVLRRLYASAADSAARDALSAPDGSRAAFRSAARRAHAAARILARLENPDDEARDVVESARRELARAWLFDDDDVVKDDDSTPASVFSPTALERRETRLAIAAIKVAFVLSARDDDPDVYDDDDDRRDDLRALEAKLLLGCEKNNALPPPPPPPRDRRTAVELLVELAAAVGGPGDEAAPSSTRVEAGRRERLTARARLRALRAAAVLAPTRAALDAAWTPDDDDQPATLVALSRRLRVVAELGAMRLPHARVVAAKGAACGIGVRAVVRTLLADHCEPRLSPTLLPLLAALLLEANDDQPRRDDDDDDDDEFALWAALFDAFARHNQWRSLLAVMRRLSARPWLLTWRADNLRPVWTAALRRPADEVFDICDRKLKPRPLWESNAQTSSEAAAADQKRRQQDLPARDALATVFHQVLAILVAAPRFVSRDDRAHLARALRACDMHDLACAIDPSSNDASLSADAAPPPPTLRASLHRAPRLSL